jgi:hypothetical protein
VGARQRLDALAGVCSRFSQVEHDALPSVLFPDHSPEYRSLQAATKQAVEQSGTGVRVSDQRKENNGSKPGVKKVLFRRVKCEGPSLHLCNSETGSGGHSNGAMAA